MVKDRRRTALFLSCTAETETRLVRLWKTPGFPPKICQVLQKLRSQCLNPVNYRAFNLIHGSIITHTDGVGVGGVYPGGYPSCKRVYSDNPESETRTRRGYDPGFQTKSKGFNEYSGNPRTPTTRFRLRSSRGITNGRQCVLYDLMSKPELQPSKNTTEYSKTKIKLQ